MASESTEAVRPAPFAKHQAARTLRAEHALDASEARLNRARAVLVDGPGGRRRIGDIVALPGPGDTYLAEVLTNGEPAVWYAVIDGKPSHQQTTYSWQTAMTVLLATLGGDEKAAKYGARALGLSDGTWD